jgi:ATP synthase protein I
MTERQSPPSPDESTQQGPTLEELDARLRKARGEEPSGGGRTGAGAGFGSGLGGAGAMLRIGIEMVSAIAVGVGIGWLLDSWLGTKPWLMVVFFFMGAAAGILGVYRATGRIAYGPGAMPRDTGDATSRGAGETTSRDAGETTKHKQDAEPSARNDRE